MQDIEEYTTNKESVWIHCLDGIWLGIPVCEGEVVLPLVGDVGKAVPPCNDVKEHEQAFFYADVGSDLGCDMLHDPVSQLEEGLLIEVAEVVEAVRDGEE